jgi:hypothetical protein
MEEKHRGAVLRMMSNKNDRKQQDTPSNHTELAFFEVVLSDFENTSYTCQTLRNNWREQLKDQANWDACFVDIMTKGRSPSWLSDTWYDYVRPKYNIYLGC